MKKIITALLIVFTAIFTANFSQVAAATKLEIAPLNNYIWVPGGAVGVAHFVVTNNSNQDQAVSIVAKSFKPDENGAPVLQSVLDFPYLFRLENNADSNLQPQPENLNEPNWRIDLDRNFIIKAGQAREVWLGIEAPLGIIEGEYPINLMFVAASDDNQSDAVTVNSGVGGNLIVLVAQSNADQSLLSIEKPKIPALVDSLRGLTLKTMIKNEGLSGTLIDGKVTLLQGEKVVQAWPLARDLVLGKSSRFARADARIDQMERASYVDTWQPSGFLIGPYTLQIEVGSGHQLRTEGAQEVMINFFAFPYLATLGVLAVLFLIFLVSKLTKRSRRQKNTLDDAKDRFSKLNQQAKAFAGSKK